MHKEPFYRRKHHMADPRTARAIKETRRSKTCKSNKPPPHEEGPGFKMQEKRDKFGALVIMTIFYPSTESASMTF